MSFSRNPYWYKLIKLFSITETKYRISTGLTIPFLFGAYEVLEAPFGNIEQLIKAIIDVEIEKYPIIQKCPDIGKHVIMVENKSYCNRYFSKFPRIESILFKNSLLISTNTMNLGKSFDRICHNLKMAYGDTIQKGEFSWSNSNDCWRKFEVQEIELIKSIK